MLATWITRVEVTSSNEGFSQVVFIFVDLEDPLINTSIWSIFEDPIKYENLSSRYVDDYENLLRITTLNVGIVISGL
jgi:hypothetical protein